MGATTAPAPEQQHAGDGAKPSRAALDQAIEQTLAREVITWKASDTGEEFHLSISHVRKLFANPTRTGQMPTDRDCWLFLQLCKARGLNPYVGDAFLVGYDEKDGKAKFSLITAHQALLKRAEASGKKKGMESGVIVRDKETKQLKETHGDFVDDGDAILGGWCKVYRTDYELPIYDRVKLSTYNKGYSRWNADPAGMIVKVAEASAHRLAFPSETGGMYVREEADSMQADVIQERQAESNKSKSERLADELAEHFESQLPAVEAEDENQDAAAEESVKRGPGRPKKAPDKYGKDSPAWVEFQCELGRCGHKFVLDAKEKLGWLNTPFDKLSTAQLLALTSELRKFKEPGPTE